VGKHGEAEAGRANQPGYCIESIVWFSRLEAQTIERAVAEMLESILLGN
jgi:hypothetical protein